MSDDIQNRLVLEAGKTFIQEGEEGYNAYLVQSGKVRVYTEKDDKKIELAELGPGSIIGEVALILDEPRGASVETVEPSTVITITRNEFEEKLTRADKTIRGVLKLLSQRLIKQNIEAVKKHELEEVIDDHALAIMQSFSKQFKDDGKQSLFMEEVLPHMNRLIKALKAFKGS
ncbi:MAG: cyclic nucleotide-binding domain-containing protein [Pseudomonadota bacterium]